MNKKTFLNISAIAITVAGQLVSFDVFTQEVPFGFEAFYEPKNKDIVFNFEGENRKIEAMISINSILVHEKKSQNQLREMLHEANVSNEYIEQLIAKLALGVTSTKKCQGELFEDCHVLSEDVDVIFNYDLQKAKIFINPKGIINQRSSSEYANGIINRNSLINHINLFSDYSTDAGSTTNLYGKATMGVTHGYIKAEYELGQNNDLSALSYTLDQPGYYWALGYFSNNVGFDSTTSHFNTNRGAGEKFSVGISSSDNLKVKKGTNSGSITYYSPVKGSLKVYQGEQLISLSNVNIGYGEIPFSELPKGIYDVRLEFSEYGQVVETYSTLVSNLNAHQKGAYEYSVFLSNHSLPKFTNSRHLESFGIESKLQNFDNNKESINYLEVAGSHSITDTMTLSEYAVISENNQQGAGVGLSYYSPYDINLNAQIKLFNNYDFYTTIYATYEELTLSYYRYDRTDYESNISEVSLSNYFHGLIDEETISVNYLKPIADDLSLRASAFITTYAHDKSLSADLELNYMLPNHWDLRLGAGYSETKTRRGLKEDEITTYFSLTIPFSNNLTAESYFSDQDGNFNSIQSVEHTNQYVDRIGYRIRTTDSNHEQEGYLNTVYSNDYLRGDINLSFNNELGYGSIFVENTQVITSNRIGFSDDYSDAYIWVDPILDNLPEDWEDTVPVGYSLLNSEGIDEEIEQSVNSSLLNVDAYQQYNYDFIVKDNHFIEDRSSLPKSNYFSIPGSVFLSSPRAIHSNRDLVHLIDINKNNVSGAECLGENCITSSEVTPGVYQVNHLRNNVLMHSENNICVIEPQERVRVDIGQCFPDIQPFDQFNVDGHNYIFLTAIIGNKNLEKTLTLLKGQTETLVNVYTINDSLHFLYMESNSKTMAFVKNKKEQLDMKEFQSISTLYQLDDQEEKEYARFQ
ncbi:TcfC E-set like domain-containing protein [Vibrio owensii]|uniref:TcfC E-set like domain-containing protein n=1 Tax=Vibrio owensii TaxID=696485 RepID=UPI0003AAF42C|nr:TcfC E-set like domain-containing protein [Vibrio owensii]